MTKRTRRNHRPAFKAKVAVAAIKGDKALGELAPENDFLSGALSKAGMLSARR